MTEVGRASAWQFWIDRGGTFTDVVARTPAGAIRVHKLLSDNPEQYDDAALEGIRQLLRLAPDAPIPASAIDAIKMGTTVATNALLERRGEPTTLAITAGLGDALRIGYQHRPDIFARHIVLPEMLYADVVEVDERVRADGTVERPIDLRKARRDLEASLARGRRALAIVLMHGYRHHAHELALAELARELGFAQVSVSHQVSPLMKVVSRGDTTVVDAYLSPILRRYVDQLARALGDVRLMFMQSNGGLVDAQLFQGKDAILSGPAGGIVGGVRVAQLAGFGRIITFDMGGTSTDVAHFAGTYERTFESEVAGVRLRAPMMAIHTVAAGGGSILTFDGARFRVGPESAGANPGPACYRRGGPLTVTDANLIVGKLHPQFFPSVFGPNGDRPLDGEIVRQKFDALAAEVARATGVARSPEELAHGCLAIAVDNMANAIKKISIRRGHDISDYVLCCFGGAAGQHACLVADALGLKTVLVHPLASVLSAYGMGLADVRAIRQRAIEATLDDALMPALRGAIAELEEEAQGELRRQGLAPARITAAARIHIRYSGTDTPLEIAAGDADELRRGFEAEHRTRYGFVVEGRSLVVEQVTVEAIGHMALIEEPELEVVPRAADAPLEPADRVLMITARAPHQPPERFTTPVFERAALRPGDRVGGPAIIVEPTTTVVVEPGWRAELSARDHLVLRRAEALPQRTALGTRADPIMLEVFNNLFMSIAEQMGVTLQNTAYSVNMKERLDFSCALFDRDGMLIANAPHMPVHLGSMGESVRTILRLRAARMSPGDVFALNNPYNGGTHLPDVTVIMPVFGADGQLLFLTAARGHHADIGGITPGSMPPDSRSIDQEGVLIDDFQLVDQGRFRAEELDVLLAAGRYPARNPRQNVADLQAQIAACARGSGELLGMLGQFGLDTVLAYTRHVQDNAEELVRRVLGALKRRRLRVSARQWRGDPRAGAHRSGGAPRHGRLHRHERAARRQFQRAGGGLPRRGAVRVPHPGRRADPDERGLSQADRDRDSGGLHAEPAPPRRGGRRQRRDLAVHHRRAVRRARGAGRGARHDEQLHLRRRSLPVLRDHLWRLGGRSGFRWHLRGPHPHDQLTADRSGSAGVALSRRAREPPHQSRLRRRRPAPWRRRHHPARPLSRAHGGGLVVQSPHRGAVRPGRRRARRLRPPVGRARRWPTGGAARLRQDRGRRGRRVRD